MKQLVLALLMVAALEPVQSKHTFAGSITDSMCAAANHSQMRMGSNDAECSIACVDAHGATFVLYDGKSVFALSDQKVAERLAGKKVSVTGTLNTDTKTIHVDSMKEVK